MKKTNSYIIKKANGYKFYYVPVIILLLVSQFVQEGP
jgi:hypothetical protein